MIFSIVKIKIGWSFLSFFNRHQSRAGTHQVFSIWRTKGFPCRKDRPLGLYPCPFILNPFPPVQAWTAVISFLVSVPVRHWFPGRGGFHPKRLYFRNAAFAKTSFAKISLTHNCLFCIFNSRETEFFSMIINRISIVAIEHYCWRWGISKTSKSFAW